MTIKTEVVNDTIFVMFIGKKFDFSMVTEFRTAYSQLDDGIKTLEVNLAETHYMDSSALGMLLNMQKMLAGKNLQYRISHCRPEVARILEISRFGKKFDIQ